MDRPSTPPAGWYPDPGGTAAWRWWDGATWTETLQPFQPATPPPARDEAVAARRLTRFGLGILGVAIGLSTVLRVLDPTTAATWHVIAHAMVRALHGQRTTSLTMPSPPTAIADLSLVVLPCQIVGMIEVLRFQHRSATAARALSIPSTLTPTMGVVGWFIPGANVVLPLLAWWGLVPTGHPLRRRMLLLWVLAVLCVAGNLAMYPIAAASSLLLGVTGAAVLVCLAVALRIAPGIIEGVVAEHRFANGRTTVEPL
jgi:hypothetical protein